MADLSLDRAFPFLIQNPPKITQQKDARIRVLFND
jgi:hypothetical protein